MGMLEVKNTELSGECKLMGSTLKSFQAMESSMTDKEVKSEDEIGSITAALEKSSSECAEMIKKRDELTMLADDLETELAEATAEKISAVDSLDNTVRTWKHLRFLVDIFYSIYYCMHTSLENFERSFIIPFFKCNFLKFFLCFTILIMM